MYIHAALSILDDIDISPDLLARHYTLKIYLILNILELEEPYDKEVLCY